MRKTSLHTAREETIKSGQCGCLWTHGGYTGVNSARSKRFIVRAVVLIKVNRARLVRPALCPAVLPPPSEGCPQATSKTPAFRAQLYRRGRTCVMYVHRPPVVGAHDGRDGTWMPSAGHS